MKRSTTWVYPSTRQASGLTLIELLVAITVGLVMIAAALTSILVARSLSSTTTEVGQLQQKAAYVFRLMGQQIRQAGSRDLQSAATPIEKALFIENTLPPTQRALQGKAAPTSEEFALSIAFYNTSQKAFPLRNGLPQEVPLHRNCLGEAIDNAHSGILASHFRRQGNDLVCAGSGDAYPIIDGVSDFLVQYMLQDSAPSNTQNFAFGDASLVASPEDWNKVYAVKVCLELLGKERMDTVGATYIRCDGSEADRGDKLRVVFHNTFHLHNKAW